MLMKTKLFVWRTTRIICPYLLRHVSSLLQNGSQELSVEGGGLMVTGFGEPGVMFALGPHLTIIRSWSRR